MQLGHWSVGYGGRQRDRTGLRVGADLVVGAVFDSAGLIDLQVTEVICPLSSRLHRKGLLIVLPLPALQYNHTFLSETFNH